MSALLSTVLAYVAFALLAVVWPGVALQRLLRVRVEPALILPLGLTACAGLHWLSLVADRPWLFPLGLALPALVLVPRWGLDRARGASRPAAPPADGPSLRGALPAVAALTAFLAVAAYPFNRRADCGGFAFNPVERIDTAFQAGLAWELAHHYPPQVPGLSGYVLSYHLGQHLVRGAAVRWAGVTPYDLLSRYDVTLCALALILALRALVWSLGGRGWALVLAGFIPLMADLSFVSGGPIDQVWWTDMLASNLQMALTFGNSLVAALALLGAALVAWRRYELGEGRGSLVLAAVLAAAVPFFKVFLATQLIAGLALALVVTRRRSTLALLVPVAAATLLLALAPGTQTVEVHFDPLAPMRRSALSLGRDVSSWPVLLAFSSAWIVAALGLRAAGLPEMLRALRARSSAGLTLAGAVLSGVLPALLLRITFIGEGTDYNEAAYFVTGSVSLLAILAVLRLGRWAATYGPVRVLAATALLTLPVTLQFAWRKAATEPELVPAHLMRVLQHLESETRPGDVVLIPPSPRFPPPPLVFHGRRVPYTRFIPYMAQFAPPDHVARRRSEVREFFETTDPSRAADVVRGLGATHVLSFGPHHPRFEHAGVLEEVQREGNAALFRVARAVPQRVSHPAAPE